jgi:hypothetical protein
MSLDLNVSPYYDDFDESKNYLKILFNPGRAVQARELTQAQTILQNQVSRFGNHIFKNGSSIIDSRISLNFKKNFFVVDVTDVNNDVVIVSNFEGRNIIGLTSGATATVTHYDTVTRKMYYNIRGGALQDGEAIETTGGTTFKATMTVGSQGKAVFANVQSGLIYIGGAFVVMAEQEIIVDSNTHNGSYHIGFTSTETIKTTADDTGLLDPANGSYNFAAPGADRLELSGVLTSIIIDANTVITPDFIEVIRVENGSITQDQNDVSYGAILDLLAERTYDESGNYTVAPFRMSVIDHKTDDTKLTAVLEPGKAYVYGYEVETIAPREITLNKARTLRTRNNISVFASYGSYVEIKKYADGADQSKGVFNISTAETVEFVTGDDGTGTVLFEGRVIATKRSSTGALRLYITGVGEDVGIISSARSVRSKSNNNTYATLEVDSITNLPYIVNNDETLLAFPLGERAIESVALNEFNYEVDKSYFGLSKTNADFVIYAPDNTSNFTGIVSRVTDSATGDDVTYAAATPTIVGSGLSYITISGVSAANIDVTLRLKKTQTDPLSKTLTTVTETITLSGSTKFTFANEDVFEIKEVKEGTNAGDATVVLPSKYIDRGFTFDTGQRDHIIDVGSLDGLTDGKYYSVTYNYFSHNGTGDYFAANSYVNATNLGFYSDIYSRIPRHNGVELRDYLDFRRKVSDIGAGVDIVVPETTLLGDFDFYLPRIDSIYVSADGTFGVNEGVSNEVPEIPVTKDNTMKIYNIELFPYTHNYLDIETDIVKNDRYTMRDIAKLERRIENIEYYTALSLLESDALNIDIKDRDGLDRFKNGILVDGFVDTIPSNVVHPEYRSAIDTRYGELRCEYDIGFKDFVPFDTDAQMIAVGLSPNTNTITLAYTTKTLIDQPYATGWMNVNPYNVFAWNGTLSLDPPSDNWIDTETLPTVTTQINTGVTDILQEQADTNGITWDRPAWRTDWWGNWNWGWWGGWAGRSQGWETTDIDVNVVRSGRRTDTTTTTSQTRAGTFQVAETWREPQDLGDRVVDTSVVPFIRSRDVIYNINGLKPNTTIIPFFDDVDVSAFCDVFTSDSGGDLTGTFSIPNTDLVKFRTGERVFRVTDNDLISTTSAEAVYTATGLLQQKQKTILSIERARLVDVNTSEDRTLSRTTTRWREPLAQTFLITETGGTFIDSIDVAFRIKAPNGGVPINLEIVSALNGYPSQNGVPFANKSVNPINVSVSSDGSAMTTFKFSDPIYLRENVEYAFVLTANTEEYEAFYGEIGNKDLVTDLMVTKQPYIGVFFKSQNASTWTADQNKDLKFKINSCIFNTNAATYKLINETLTANDVNKITTARFNIDTLDFEDTSLKYSYKFTGETNYTPFLNKEDTHLAEEKELTGSAGANKKVDVNVEFVSTNVNISPVVNRNRSSLITANNLAWDDGDPDTTGVALNAGTYVSREVTLTNPSDDLKVLLDVVKPNNSDVFVHYRTSDFTPRYVESTTVPYDWVNKQLYLYWIDASGPGLTQKTVATATKTADGRVYLKLIGDTTYFIDSTNQGGLGLKDVRLIETSELTTIENWGSGVGSVVGLHRWHQNKLWKAIEADDGSNEPTVDSTVWQEVESMSAESVVTTGSVQRWKPMKVETSASVSVVEQSNNFIEYSYVPAEAVLTDFGKFTIKIEMRSKNTVDIPLCKRLRSIAIF